MTATTDLNIRNLKAKRQFWKQKWRSTWKRIIQGSDNCLVCGAPLTRAAGQIVKYCSKQCRLKRHNKRAS